VGAHRRHAGAAADEHHLVVGVFGEELAEGAGDVDLVARLAEKMYEDMIPGGVPSGARGGGVAIRTFSMMMPNSSG
jgi:hypothetical protein